MRLMRVYPIFRITSWATLSLALLLMAPSVGRAQVELPARVRADLLANNVIEALKEGNPAKALVYIDSIKRIREVPFPTPLLWVEARAAFATGRHYRAYSAITRFVNEAERGSEEYNRALQLLPQIERAFTKWRDSVVVAGISTAQADAQRGDVDSATTRLRGLALMLTSNNAMRNPTLLRRVVDTYRELGTAHDTSMVRFTVGGYLKGVLAGDTSVIATTLLVGASTAWVVQDSGKVRSYGGGDMHVYTQPPNIARTSDGQLRVFRQLPGVNVTLGDALIWLDGQIAGVWAPYRSEFEGRIVCGYVGYSLVEQVSSFWQITGSVYSTRPEGGCPTDASDPNNSSASPHQQRTDVVAAVTRFLNAYNDRDTAEIRQLSPWLSQVNTTYTNGSRPFSTRSLSEFLSAVTGMSPGEHVSLVNPVFRTAENIALVWSAYDRRQANGKSCGQYVVTLFFAFDQWYVQNIVDHEADPRDCVVLLAFDTPAARDSTRRVVAGAAAGAAIGRILGEQSRSTALLDGQWQLAFRFESNSARPAEPPQTWVTFDATIQQNGSSVSGTLTSPTVAGDFSCTLVGRRCENGTMRLPGRRQEWQTFTFELDPQPSSSGRGRAEIVFMEGTVHRYTFSLTKKSP